MNKDAGKGEPPEVSPELTKLRVIVEIRKKDLGDAVAKMNESKKKCLGEFDELKKQRLPADVVLTKIDHAVAEYLQQVFVVVDAAAKLIAAYQELTNWYEKSLLGKE